MVHIFVPVDKPCHDRTGFDYLCFSSKWTLSQLDSLMQSSVISGVGDPVYEIDEHSWIQIIR